MTRSPQHVLMLADIDLAYPDARRVHVTEIARGLVAAGCEVELVSRGPDPGIEGVSYVAAAGSQAGKLARLARVNAVALRRVAVRRRDARSLYVRYDWGVLLPILAGRVLGYRVVLEVNALTSVAIADGGNGLERRAVERVKRAAVVAAWRSAHRLLPVTEHLRNRLVSEFGAPPERVEIVANGADAELFAPRDRAEAARSVGLDPADEHVVFVGLLAWWNDSPRWLSERLARVAAEGGLVPSSSSSATVTSAQPSRRWCAHTASPTAFASSVSWTTARSWRRTSRPRACASRRAAPSSRSAAR